MQTSAIPQPTKPLSLDELTRFLQAAPGPPVGFILSTQIMEGLRARLPLSFRDNRHLAGIPVVVDPDLPEAEFEVANTVEVWERRKREIAQRWPC